MTTVAFRDGVLAADTLSTTNGLRDDYGVKVWKFRGVIGAAAGSRALCLKFQDWIRGGMQGDCPFEGQDDGNGFIAAPNGVAVCWSTNGPWPVRAPFYALGSGYQLAMGAMEAGASAEEAVRVAIKHDTGTGGEVVAVRL